MKRGAIAGAALVSLEAAYALLRPAPAFVEHDPSGVFGDPRHPPLRVVVLGDSSVTGPGVSDIDEIWVRVLARRLAQGRHVILKSVAVGGSKVADLLDGQLEEAILFDPDLVLVAVGANDAIRGVPLRKFERDLDALVVELVETGATVVQSGVGDLGTIPRLFPPLRGMMTRRSLAYHRAHQRVARRHGAVVAELRDDDRTLWIRDRSLWSEDLFHVSGAGHARWAETAWKTLQPVIGDG
ncbi:MAG: SGNH/GDSL hydrolase family protein [Actinobacteria bacterium]|nr:SGNH/GDSL hydrolase family protein [Actinomycetota bacterium]MCI0679136.1 SGNH/GDSL hydrolase family protein [Actinomycetota bacterium]